MKLVKRSRFVLTLLSFIIFSIYLFSYEKEVKNISTTVADSLSNLGKKTVAVVDFTDLQGNVTELGRFLAEEISVALASSAKNFEVIDRTHLKAIIQENKLSSTGLIDPQTAIKLGQITGVEALVTGTITPFGDSIRLSVKVLDTKSAKVVGACSADIAKTKAIEELLQTNLGNLQKSTNTETTQIRTSTTSSGIIGKVEIDNYIFELRKCYQSGSVLTFEFIVVNKEKDRKLYLSNPRIITENAEEINKGNFLLGSYGWYSSVGNLMPTDVPVKLIIKFENIGSLINKVLFLEFQKDGPGPVQFRNIPVSH